MIRQVASAVEFDVRVIPRAKKTELAGARGEAILVRLAAPPVEGAANDALIAFLSSLLGTPRSRIHVISGARSRQKRIKVDGFDVEAVRSLLQS